jgi:hypothetical protein
MNYRLLVSCVWLITIARVSHAQLAAPEYAPTNYYAINVVSDNEDFARQSLGITVRRQLADRKYDDLEKSANTLRDTKERMPNGDWTRSFPPSFGQFRG